MTALLSKVTLRKRLDVEGMVRRRFPKLCEEIGSEILKELH